MVIFLCLKCERLDDFGRGICFLNGKIVFVPNMLPLEEGEVKIILEKKKYSVGKLESLKNVSPFRVQSECRCESCGCHLKHMSYEATLEYKVDKVKNILKKFGGVNFDSLNIISSKFLGYRNKVTLKVLDGRLGYFKNESHDINEIDRCLIATSNINKVIAILKNEDLSKVTEIVIRDMEGIMVSISGNVNIENLKGFVKSIYMNDVLVYGDSRIKNKIGKYEFLVSYDSFFQVNNDITLKLYEKVKEYAGTGDVLLDLFCGCGTIGIFLSDNFNKVIGVDINNSSVACARENALINKVGNAEFLCGDANALVKGRYADALILDPARSGVSEEGIKNILNILPKKIIYVSCNPVTLARDIKLLDKYEVKYVTLFDMFPLTYHVESIALLELK